MLRFNLRPRNMVQENKIGNWLGIIQAFIAIGAVPAGLSMIFDPSGNGIGMTTEILAESPFNDFFIPGIFLFAVNGLFNILGAFLSFSKNKYAGEIGLGLGVLLVIWICIQVYITGLIHFLQPLFFVIGVIEIILSYRYFY